MRTERAIVKPLLQHMTELYITNQPEFKAAIVHFNITTTAIVTDEDEGVTTVIVFSPQSIANNPHGVRYEFDTMDQAQHFAMIKRASGDAGMSYDSFATVEGLIISNEMHGYTYPCDADATTVRIGEDDHKGAA